MNEFIDIFHEESFKVFSEDLNNQLEKGIISTSDLKQEEKIMCQSISQDDNPIEEIRDEFEIIRQLREEDSLGDDLNRSNQNSQKFIVSAETPKKKKINKKNSNVIKKFGRMILNQVHRYRVDGQLNNGITNMMEMLEKKKREKKTLKDKKDGFNTSHLKAMFNSCSSEDAAHNLKVSKQIFNKALRKEVFESIQIPEDNQTLYLNTLKCAALRFSNRSLALRLQLSQNS